MSDSEIDWKTQGVKVISGDHLDVNTPQTEGMNRAAGTSVKRCPPFQETAPDARSIARPGHRS